MQRNDGVPVGVCSKCHREVYKNAEGWWVSCCADAHVDTSWNARINPLNVQWLPGYRFYVLQPSRTVRRTHRMTPRTYKVRFEIDADGLLRHSGGVKPTPRTLANVEALYARERPGSNGGPPISDTC